MMRLNRLLAVAFALGMPALTYAADPAPIVGPAASSAAGELPANATADQVLDALDQRGKSMQEFTATVKLKAGDPDVGDESTRIGKISLQKKSDDSTLVRVQFTKRLVGRILRDEKSDYLLDNGTLTDRDYHKKIENIREVARPGEKINLLKLGEGPFPLPIGQDKADVHKQFAVKMIPLAKEDPPNTIHLELKPLPDTRFFKRFNAIHVWVDRKTNFPARIKTAAGDGSDVHTTDLEDVTVNPSGGLKPDDFQLPLINSQEWNRYTLPYRE
jgi:outer membrane lipoprotein-sorting protein